MSGRRVYHVQRSISFTTETLQELDWMCDKANPARRYANRSDAVNQLMDMGLFLLKNQEKIRSGEMEEKIQSVMESETLMDWLQTLSAMQLSGLREMITYIEDGKQRRLAV